MGVISLPHLEHFMISLISKYSYLLNPFYMSEDKT